MAEWLFIELVDTTKYPKIVTESEEKVDKKVNPEEKTPYYHVKMKNVFPMYC